MRPRQPIDCREVAHHRQFRARFPPVRVAQGLRLLDARATEPRARCRLTELESSSDGLLTEVLHAQLRCARLHLGRWQIEGVQMFKKRSALTLSLVVSLLAGGVTVSLVVAASGLPALAASTGVTCPDNTTGVTDGSWSIVCTGQTAAAATVTITSAKPTSVGLSINPAKTDAFTTASSSFNGQCPCAATVQIAYGLQGGVSQTVSIFVKNTSGRVLDGVAAQNTSTPAHPHGAVVTILGR